MDPGALLEQGHVRVKQCRIGPLAYLPKDQYVGRSLDRYGEFSAGESELFRQVARPGWTVLDVGANIGAHTVFLAQHVGRAGMVWAFEPQRVIFQLLCTNVTLNALTNVRTLQAAAGRAAGTILVPPIDYAESENFGGLPLGQWKSGESVPLVTIDSLNLPVCHFIKIDVEGMEGEAIAGAEQTIRRFQPALYVENDRADSSAALIRQLLALDYRLYWHLTPLFNPQNFFGRAENDFPGVVSVNMLALPRSASQSVQGFDEITNPDENWQAYLARRNLAAKK